MTPKQLNGILPVEKRRPGFSGPDGMLADLQQIFGDSVEVDYAPCGFVIKLPENRSIKVESRMVSLDGRSNLTIEFPGDWPVDDLMALDYLIGQGLCLLTMFSQHVALPIIETQTQGHWLDDIAVVISQWLTTLNLASPV